MRAPTTRVPAVFIYFFFHWNISTDMKSIRTRKCIVHMQCITAVLTFTMLSNNNNNNDHGDDSVSAKSSSNSKKPAAQINYENKIVSIN